MIRHVAMFRWADTVDDAHVAAVGAGLDSLPRAIPEIAGYHHGPDLGFSETTFDYVVVGEFATAADYAVYRDHPEHRALIEALIAGYVTERATAQYELRG